MTTANDPRPLPSPSARLHEVTMAALQRAHVATADIEIGQEARTKEWYVKSLRVPMAEREGWKPWLERVGAMAALALQVLPQPNDPNGG